MKKVAFIGSYDKADMIICIAKLLTIMKKKVIVIDATALSKTRYIVPTMQSSKQYITTYENVDVAIGFENFEQIKAYSSLSKTDELDYDYALIDIDSYKGYYYFGIKPEDKKFFVTSFDLYSLRRGLQVLRKIPEPVEVKKVLFTKDMDPKERQYLNFLSKGIKVKWDEDIVYFPFETSDLNAIYSNQRSGRIQLKGLSATYIDGIEYLVEEISDASQGEVKKTVKILEKN
ncbi:hypothetical protein [uncultured Clostridium sp.]|uniref:hypothetical protein n=1 Tax=uncultured Clostridium sp. TaxID=59620 RepID=UPI0026EFC7CB|nr:hypothetical protein [uncultured Clostridium sp.]